MVVHLAQRKATALAWRRTSAIHARLGIAALGVGPTALNLMAFDVRIAGEAVHAAALDRMIGGRAFGVLAARIDGARIDAAPVQAVAQFRWRAIFVVLADRIIATYMFGTNAEVQFWLLFNLPPDGRRWRCSALPYLAELVNSRRPVDRRQGHCR